MDQLDYTKLCVESLLEHTPPEQFELIVIDNGSGSETAGHLQTLSTESGPVPPVKIIRFDENQGIAPAWNAGIRAARGRYLVFADNDVLFSAGWLDGLLAGFTGDDVWATVPNITEMFVPTDFGRRAPDMLSQPLMTDVEILSGSFFVLPTKTIMRMGTFDERFAIGPYADLDYQFRLMTAGKKVMRVHNVCIHHFEGRTVTQIPGFFDELEEQNRRHFEQKWNPSVPLPPMKEDFEFEIWTRKVKMVPPPDREEIRRRTQYEADERPSSTPARIVACVNVFNDLKVLPDCIASLKDVDEIVIVDGAYAAIEHDVPYSTDGTLEYVKDLAAHDERIRIVECTRAWADEPTKRSAYFIGADGDWYLQIDADERLEAAGSDGRPETAGDEQLENQGGSGSGPVALLRDHLTSCLLDVHSLPRYDLDTTTSRYFPRLFRHRDGIHYDAAHWNVVVEDRTVAADWSAFLPVAGIRLIHLRHERPAARLNVQDTYYKQMLATEAAAFERRAEEIEKTLTGDARRDAAKLELMWTYVSAAAYQREYHETQ